MVGYAYEFFVWVFWVQNHEKLYSLCSASKHEEGNSTFLSFYSFHVDRVPLPFLQLSEVLYMYIMPKIAKISGGSPMKKPISFPSDRNFPGDNN